MAPVLSLQSSRGDELAVGADWRFVNGDTSLDADVSSWETVTVPHTWNILMSHGELNTGAIEHICKQEN